jgi:hypothetical protein
MLEVCSFLNKKELLKMRLLSRKDSQKLMENSSIARKNKTLCIRLGLRFCNLRLLEKFACLFEKLHIFVFKEVDPNLMINIFSKHLPARFKNSKTKMEFEFHKRNSTRIL